MDQSEDILRERLREAIDSSPLSQREIARRSRTSLTTIQRILSGDSSPTVGTLSLVCKTLGITMVWLMGGPKENDREIKLRKAKELLDKVKDIDYALEIIETFVSGEASAQSSAESKKA